MIGVLGWKTRSQNSRFGAWLPARPGYVRWVTGNAIYIDIYGVSRYEMTMQNFLLLLTHIKAAIAVRAARHPALTGLFVALYARVSRMGTRMERLFARWQAGIVPKPRAPRAARTDRARGKPDYPTHPDWLFVHAQEVTAFGGQLAHMMQHPDFARFVAEMPQAARILRPLLRMLGAGVVSKARRVVRPRAVWDLPAIEAPRVRPGGLVQGPGGRLVWG